MSTRTGRTYQRPDIRRRTASVDSNRYVRNPFNERLTSFIEELSRGEMDPTTEAHLKSEHHMEEASSDAVEVDVRPEEVPLPASTLWVSSAGSEPEEVVTVYNTVDVETLKEAPERKKAQLVEMNSIMEETPLNKNSSMEK